MTRTRTQRGKRRSHGGTRDTYPDPEGVREGVTGVVSSWPREETTQLEPFPGRDLEYYLMLAQGPSLYRSR